MKKNKAPGPDNILIEMLKEADDNLKTLIGTLLNKCLEMEDIPKI